MPSARIDLPQGTLDLLILRTLALGAPASVGYRRASAAGLERRPAYPAGVAVPGSASDRATGWTKAHWGTSENNCRGKYYALTQSGHKQLEVEKNTWAKLTAAVAQVLETD
jgi:PadR family transcriptional regulator, regulatory protein PadR